MDETYEPLAARGAAVRTQVLGEEWVTGHAEAARDFGAGYQDVASALAWGGIWCRPGLSLRDRSLLTLAVLVARGREEELAGHIRGAMRLGVTRAELEEVFIHVGLYAGFPMAVGANRVAQRVLAETADGQAPSQGGA